MVGSVGDRGRLVAVCVAQPVPVEYAPATGATAIDKRPVSGPARVTVHGVEGDAQADRRNHGGRDKAVYAYGAADAARLAERFGRAVPPGAVGDNLRIDGIEVSQALVGERWRIGSVVVEVVQPRIPCRTFAGFWEVPDLIERFLDAGMPGAYLAVVEEGSLTAGDEVEVLAVPHHDVTVADVSRIRTRDLDEAGRLLAASRLPEDVREWARRRTA